MDFYILSKKTEEDIEAIYQFGEHKFVKDQAIEYLIELRSYFELLTKNPDIGKQRNEIKEGLLNFPFSSHVIFHRILSDHIRIVRILHGSRDLKKFL